ncbi:MAG: DUF5667 domain-containing protein [Candidatus Pacebacteria bacterium]|nr:DUF5667 domain-containing protein [Candidatus Paceibacterota bacterium]
MRKIFISFTILLFFTGAFSVSARDNELSSAGITPDNPFYFLKIWKESIQTFFIFGAENKVKQYLHLAEVRLAEYEKMIEKGKDEIAKKTLEKYENQLNRALEKAEQLKEQGKNIEDISQKTEDILSKHIDVLQKNLEKVPDSAKKGIENAIEASSKVFNKIGLKSKEERACIRTGGTVSVSSCCKSASDFPNTCLIGACGCSLENSHEVKVCECQEGKCFDGNKCAEISLE